MRLRRSTVVVLLLLATCNEEHPGNVPGPGVESFRASLGVVPASEVATWTLISPPVGGPDPRSLQTAAFDETRKVLVMFGGLEESAVNIRPITELGELWEWDSAAGAWTELGDFTLSIRAGTSEIERASARQSLFGEIAVAWRR